MNRTGRRLLAVAGIGAVLALAVPLSSATSASSSEAEPKVLRVGVPNDLTTANPLSLRSGSDWNVATIQYDMMLQFGNEDLSPQPGLAEGCEPNNDKTEWTCTLQDGVLWSDGEPFTSQDVAFTYKLVIDQGISTYAQYFSEGTTFETPDDTTLIWKSPTPTSQPLTPPWIYILPEHVWSQYADLDKADLRAVENVPSVTTGPFTLTEVNRGQNWTLTKNPNYWGDEPNFDEIRFQLFTNQDAMAQALKQGDIDVATYLESSLLPSLDRRHQHHGPAQRLRLVAQPGLQLRRPERRRRPATRASGQDRADGDRDGDRQAGHRRQGLRRSGYPRDVSDP